MRHISELGEAYNLALKINMKSVFRVSVLLILFSSFFFEVHCQEILGTPFINNFKRTEYNAGRQTWDIEQGQNGMMYFANNDGLLEFSGVSWEVYPLPNKSVLRTIEPGENYRLYAGGFNEIGYYTLGKEGGGVYHSLNYLLPKEYSDFDDVWKIYRCPDGIIFQSYNQLMLYNSDTIKVIKAPSEFHFSFISRSEYYVDDKQNGLMRFARGRLYPQKGMEKLRDVEIWGLLPLGKQLLISTVSEGNYVYNGNELKQWESPSTEFLKENQIFCSLKLENGNFAFGTIQNGVLICDGYGNVIQHINMQDGLQNNTILSMTEDNSGNLWLGTDHGIDYVEIKSAITQMANNYGFSSGYTAVEYKGRLYLGTNQGLYVKELKSDKLCNCGSKEMQLIEETKGQVWDLQVIDDKLFCGHNYGTLIIDGYHAKKISNVPGVWIFLQVPNDSSRIVAGCYTGLLLFEKKNNKWQFVKQFEDFAESSRKIEFDADGTLWITHGYKGIYRVTFNSGYTTVQKVDFFNNKNSMLPEHVNSVNRFDDKIFFLSSRGVLRYSSESNNFFKAPLFQPFFGEQNVKLLKRDSKGNIWYFVNEIAGVLRRSEDGRYNNISLPFKGLEGNFVNGFEFVYPYTKSNVLFGVENGFVVYNSNLNINYRYGFRSYITEFRSYNPDTVFVSQEDSIKKAIQMRFDSNNSIEYSYAANDFKNYNNIYFSTFLEGYDNSWSEWQKRNIKEYTNLIEGKYIFRIKAKNIYGTESDIQQIAFEILPPFYRSVTAYITYAILFLCFLIFLAYSIIRRFENARKEALVREQEIFRKREEQLQHERLAAEKQVIRIRNEALRSKMVHKEKELANATMHIIHKNEFLVQLKERLKKLQKLNSKEDRDRKVDYLIKNIDKDIDSESYWKVFETHLEQVHEEFLKRLQENHSDLNIREKKLCAYLKMGMSSKEIASLMNISYRAIENNRYYLRQKLNVQKGESLVSYINTI